MSTIDSITIETTRPVCIELAKRVRPPASSKTNAIRVSTTIQKNACSQTRRGSGAIGSRFSSTAPRIGSDLPRAYKTTMITTNGRKLRTPVCIHARLPSNHVTFLTSSRVCTAPSAKPPATAIGMERRPPIRAAASAGTIRAVSPTGVIVPAIGPTMITESVASTEAITQLMAASVCGEKPSRTAPFSLPAAARVARPKRRYR